MTPSTRTLTVTSENLRPDGTKTFLELKYHWDADRFIPQSRTER